MTSQYQFELDVYEIIYCKKKSKKVGMYKYGVFILFKRKTANRLILFPQKMLAKHFKIR